METIRCGGPPILSEQAKLIDPTQDPFFTDGNAEFPIAWKNGKPNCLSCEGRRALQNMEGYAERSFICCLESCFSQAQDIPR